MSHSSVYYHGTTADIVPAIQREGLRPEMARAYNFLSSGMLLGQLMGDPKTPTDSNNRTHDGFIFLTADLEAAQLFAEFRARYEMYPANSLLTMGKSLMLKQHGEYQRKGDVGVPVILELHIPQELSRNIIVDNRADHQLYGYMFKGILPPETITRIIAVNGMEGLIYDSQTASFKKAA